MSTTNIKILISVVLIIATFSVAYLLDFAKWKDISNVNAQIEQVKALTNAKTSYYTVIDSKIRALTDAGWSTKKASILINFDESLFFTPKINYFFKTIVASSGMTLSGMTNSAPESITAQAQPVANEGGSKTSKGTSVNVAPQLGATSFGQLQGPVKKTTVNLNVTGTYNAFKNLLSQLQGQTRIASIKSIAVTSASQQEDLKTKTLSRNNLSFSVVLDVYSY